MACSIKNVSTIVLTIKEGKTMSFAQKLDKYFGISKRGSNFKRELLGGLVTFLSLAYILAVNPSMLSGSGAYTSTIDVGSVFMATAISAGLTTIFMGLYAKLPIALAPGMGVNAFFGLTVCAPWGFNKSWQFALACVLISGIIFVIISLTGARKWLINAIPTNMKYAVSAGIGAFIAFIGLINCGVVYIDTASALPSLGSFSDPVMIVGLLGILITVVLMIRKVKGAIFLGLIATCVIGLVGHYLGLDTSMAGATATLPSFDNLKWTFSSMGPTFGACFSALGEVVTSFDGWIIIIMFLFVDFFDTAGTLVGVGTAANLVDDKGNIENVDRALLVDATGTVIGAVCGTSTVTSFVESAAGVEAGARTGLASIFTGILLLLSILISPIILNVVTSVVTGPALVVVGILMAANIKKIDWTNFVEAAPAYVTFIAMPLTYSISNGMALGFITYAVCEVAAGRAKKVPVAMWVLVGIFIAYFIFSAVV